MYGRGTIFIFISCVLAILELDIGSQDVISYNASSNHTPVSIGSFSIEVDDYYGCKGSI